VFRAYRIFDSAHFLLSILLINMEQLDFFCHTVISPLIYLPAPLETAAS